MVKMSTSYFKNTYKLGDSSNFVAWKIRLEIISKDNDVLKYLQGKVLKPPENAPTAAKTNYKKGELKAKKIILDGLQDHLLAYVGNLKKSKEMYNKLVGMYEVNNQNEIISLKNQLKDMEMNKGESVQS